MFFLLGGRLHWSPVTMRMKINLTKPMLRDALIMFGRRRRSRNGCSPNNDPIPDLVHFSNLSAVITFSTQGEYKKRFLWMPVPGTYHPLYDNRLPFSGHCTILSGCVTYS